MFALSHGLLVGYLASKVGASLDTFKVLGDDIVIRGDRLAVLYLDTLKDLGVPVSTAKTMASTEVFEFAKRWFLRGTEVSPFPVSACHEHLRSPHGTVETFRLAAAKGWEGFQDGAGPGLVKRLHATVGYSRIFTRKFLEWHADALDFPDPRDRKVAVEEKLARLYSRHVHLSCVSGRSHIRTTAPHFLWNALGEILEQDVFRFQEELDLHDYDIEE